jgi:hypothetical protein
MPAKLKCLGFGQIECLVLDYMKARQGAAADRCFIAKGLSGPRSISQSFDLVW